MDLYYEWYSGELHLRTLEWSWRGEQGGEERTFEKIHVS